MPVIAPHAWQGVAALALALVAATTFVFLRRRLTLVDGRLQARERHVAPHADPYSGRPAWPRPQPTPVSLACHHPQVLRILLVLTMISGAWYILWRWTVVDWNHAWLSVSLAAAETVTYLEIFLISLFLWRLEPPVEPPPPLENASVDIYITCYNEGVDLVLATVRATKAVRYPHDTYILDDGRNPLMRAMAHAEGVGYIMRASDWMGRNRHAKAGNINHALPQTRGDFILFQDADQIPYPEILDRTLGFFRDERVAIVQTPHWFYNAPPDDPLGTQQPIFYGPVMQGKNGFNAAFFCGSNGVIRRTALMEIGAEHYTEMLEKRFRRVFRAAQTMIAVGIAENHKADVPSGRMEQALVDLRRCIHSASARLVDGVPLHDVTEGLQQKVEDLSTHLVTDELRELQSVRNPEPHPEAAAVVLPMVFSDLDDSATIENLAKVRMTPLSMFDMISRLISILAVHEVQVQESVESGSLRRVTRLGAGVHVDHLHGHVLPHLPHRSRDGRAIGERGQATDAADLPVLPFSTCSVTEDMATAMRVHAKGWRSVYHHEVLARGLAPDDLRSAVAQRLRWAQGAFQISIRENPFKFRELSLVQKSMYLHSALAYLSGFAIPVFLIAPAAYVLFGVPAITGSGADLLLHMLPYFLFGQLAYRFWTAGLDTWRAEQYAIASFPLWIKSAWTAVRDTLGLDRLTFVVTPKTAQKGSFWVEVRWQLIFLALMLATVVVGLGRIALGWDPEPGPTLVNVAWAWLDLLFLSVVIDAALYRAPENASGGTVPSSAAARAAAVSQA